MKNCLLIAIIMLLFPARILCGEQKSFSGNKPILLQYQVGEPSYFVYEDGNPQGYNIFSGEVNGLMSKNDESKQLLDKSKGDYAWALSEMIPGIFLMLGGYYGQVNMQSQGHGQNWIWGIEVSGLLLTILGLSSYASYYNDMSLAVFKYNRFIYEKISNQDTSFIFMKKYAF